MAAIQSTRAHSATKPEKPYPSFPLFPHASGKWAKKVRGRLFYFGRWADPHEALRLYQAWCDASSKSPASTTATGAYSVQRAVNDFLSAKEHKVVSGELARRTWQTYYATGRLVVAELGRATPLASLSPTDFIRLRARIAQQRNPIGVGNEVTRIKTMLLWAARAAKLPPIDFGEEFCRPPKAAIRRHKAVHPRQLFTAGELRRIIAAADDQLRAMVLLALNAGLGNNDIADLRISVLDLTTGWCDFPRKKTAVRRRFCLWRETRQAVEIALASRPTPRSRLAHDRVFLRPSGVPWDGSCNDNQLSRRFTELLRGLGLDRPGQSFYLLRHCFSDWAQELGDDAAVDILMGHASSAMRLTYRHHFPDSRLLRVTDHVRSKVFGCGEG